MFGLVHRSGDLGRVSMPVFQVETFEKLLMNVVEKVPDFENEGHAHL